MVSYRVLNFAGSALLVAPTLRPQLGDCSDHSPTTLGDSLISPHAKLGDCSDHSPTTLGDLLISPHAVLGDCPDHSPTTTRGLFSSTTCELTHIQLRGIYFVSTLLQGLYFTF
jgi:hypothetical protein